MTLFSSLSSNTTNIKYQVYFLVLSSSLFQGATSLYSLYLSSQGISDYDISLHYSILGLGSILGSVSGGFLGEYCTVKRLSIILNISLLFAILGLMYYTPSLIFSFLIGNGITTNKSNVLNYFSNIQCKKIAETALSYRRFLLNLGVAIGAWLIGVLLQIDDQYFTMFCFIILILNLVVSIFLPPIQNQIQKPFNSINKKESQKFWLLCLYFVIALFPFALLPNLYLLHLKNEIGFTEATVGTIFFVNGAMIILLQISIIKLLENVATKWKCSLGVLFIGLGIGGVVVTQNILELYFGVFLWTLGEMILFVPFLTFFLKNSPFSKGKTIGMYQLCFAFSDFIYPLIASQIILISRSYLWVLVILISMISSVVSIKIIK